MDLPRSADVNLDLAYARFERAVRRTPALIVLMGMAHSFDQTNAQVMEYLGKEFSFTNDFAPWDAAMLPERIENVIRREFSEYFCTRPIQTKLRSTLRELNLEDANTSSYFYFRQPTLRGLSRDGIHVIVTRDSESLETGETHDHTAIGKLLCKAKISTSGFKSYRVLFHEYGHALHFNFLKSEYPSLRESFPVFYTEALATAFESMTSDPDWLETFTRLTPTQIMRLRRLRFCQEIYRLRENIAFSIIETAAYGDLEVNMDETWCLVAKVLLYPSREAFEINDFSRYHQRLVMYQGSAEDTAMTIAISAAMRRHLAVANGGKFLSAAFRNSYEPFASNALDWNDLMRNGLGKEYDPFELGSDLLFLSRGVF